MSRLRHDLPITAVLSLVVAIGLSLVGASRSLVDASLLVGAVALGDRFVLRLGDVTGIPLMYAPLMVITAGFNTQFGVAIWVVTIALNTVLSWPDPLRIEKLRASLLTVLGGVAVMSTYQLVSVLFGQKESMTQSLVALGASAAMIVVSEEATRRRSHCGSSVTGRGVRAWSALLASGALMALGYRGIDGRGGSGLWSVALFSIPLLATWYSFERLETASRTHRQTLRALSMATELGGFVSHGHGQRVAELCERIAAEVGLGETETEGVIAAAYLHHLGAVTLDNPPSETDPGFASQIAAVTSEMLRDIPALRAASQVVSGQGRYSRDLKGSRTDRMASQVLKVSSDFDDLVAGDASRSRLALETLYSSPGYVYNRRVLEALEVVVGAR